MIVLVVVVLNIAKRFFSIFIDKNHSKYYNVFENPLSQN